MRVEGIVGAANVQRRIAAVPNARPEIVTFIIKNTPPKAPENLGMRIVEHVTQNQKKNGDIKMKCTNANMVLRLSFLNRKCKNKRAAANYVARPEIWLLTTTIKPENTEEQFVVCVMWQSGVLS